MKRIAMAACVALGGLSAVRASADELIPRWLYPLNPPAVASTLPDDTVTPRHVPGSAVTYTTAQLNDAFIAPDWHPSSHTPMPAIVVHGRPPAVGACGKCHTPGGQDRPENASLAGLPATYIARQIADFKSGARRGAWHGPYRPVDSMVRTAEAATPQEVAVAAEYFAKQRLKQRVRVVETSLVPRAHVVSSVYAALPGAGDEVIGLRLLEFAPDPQQQENRDETMIYTAYVPRGSVARGRAIAQRGGPHGTPPCMSCHGPSLQGIAAVPGLAGRSPSYLLHALSAFKTGARGGTATGLPMQAVTESMELGDMIAVAAYAASLPP